MAATKRQVIRCRFLKGMVAAGAAPYAISASALGAGDRPKRAPWRL